MTDAVRIAYWRIPLRIGGKAYLSSSKRFMSVNRGVKASLVADESPLGARYVRIPAYRAGENFEDVQEQRWYVPHVKRRHVIDS